MLDVEKVKEQLAALAGDETAQQPRFAPLIAQAAAMADISGDDEVDSRLALLAAAKVNYWIAQSDTGDAQVTSFKAGDISITESTDRAGAALQLLQALESDSALTGESGFVFRTV